MKIVFLFPVACLLNVLFADTSDAQWLQIGGPFRFGASSYTAIGRDQFLSSGMGVFRSTDDGLNWSITGLSGLSYPQAAILAVGSSLISASGISGVRLSSDLGKTWTSQKSGFQPYNCGNIALAAIGTDVFVAQPSGYATCGGIFRSQDLGVHWNPASKGLTDSSITSLIASGNSLLTGTSRALFLSTNLGSEWTSVGPATTSLAMGSSALIAGTGKGVYRSTDNGRSWTPTTLTQSIGSVAAVGTTFFAATALSYPYGLLPIYRSTNNGDTWAVVNTGLPDSNASRLSTLGQTVFVDNQYGIARSMDGGATWATPGRIDQYGYTNYLSADGGNLFLCPSNGLVVSTDCGMSWENRGDGPGGQILTLFRTGEFLFAGTPNGIFRSTDDGLHWLKKDDGITRPDAISFTMSGTNLIAGLYVGGTFVSTDFGDSWKRLDPVPTDTLLSFNGFETLGSDLFATAFGVYRSTDRGETWSRTTCPTIATAITAIGTDFFAGGSDGVYHSADRGASWGVAGNFPTSVKCTVNCLRAFGNALIAGTECDLFVSLDKGKNWSRSSEGIPIDYTKSQGGFDAPYSAHSFAVCGTDLFIETVGDGVWHRPLTELVGNQFAVHNEPVSLNNLRVYPNPSSESTTISVSSNVPGYASISIINQVGIEVAHIFSGELESGEHHFDWGNLSTAPSGPYECLIRHERKDRDSAANDSALGNPSEDQRLH